jgi:hypothetical protein
MRRASVAKVTKAKIAQRGNATLARMEFVATVFASVPTGSADRPAPSACVGPLSATEMESAQAVAVCAIRVSMVATALLLNATVASERIVNASMERVRARMVGPARIARLLNVKTTAPGTVFAMTALAFVTLVGRDLIVRRRNVRVNPIRILAVATVFAIASASNATAMRNGRKRTARAEPARTTAAITVYVTTAPARVPLVGQERIVVKRRAWRIATETDIATLEFASVTRSTREMIVPLPCAPTTAATSDNVYPTEPVRVSQRELVSIAPLNNALMIAMDEESVKDWNASALRNILEMIAVFGHARMIATMPDGAMTANVNAFPELPWARMVNAPFKACIVMSMRPVSSIVSTHAWEDVMGITAVWTLRWTVLTTVPAVA